MYLCDVPMYVCMYVCVTLLGCPDLAGWSTIGRHEHDVEEMLHFFISPKRSVQY